MQSCILSTTATATKISSSQNLLINSQIAVLIAISVFSSRLEQSRETTDIAKMCSAYATSQIAALSGLEDGSKITDTYEAYYDPDGLVSADALKGQGTATNRHVSGDELPDVCSYNPTDDVRQSGIKNYIESGSANVVSFAS